VKILALSSCEVEYREAKEAVWLHHVLKFLGLIQKYATELRCDNQGAIQLAYNLVYHSKTKHIDLDAHYIRDLVANGTISLVYCTYSLFVGDEGSCHQGGALVITPSSINVGFSPSHY
jgi:hypothetical protein